VLRYVLAVVVAVAVVGVALPAIERAELRHDGDRLGRDARRVATATDRLAATTDPGGRELVTVGLPEREPGEARYLWVDPLTDTVRWRVDGSRERRLRVDADLLAGVTLREAGRHRLAIEHVRRGGRRGLVVREFKSERSATAAYAVRAVPRGRRGLWLSPLGRR
jgi:hypothetical protein